MAQMTELGFRPGNSRFHTTDPRVKLFSLALFGMAGMKAGALPLLIVFCGMIILSAASRIRLFPIFKELRFFIIFLIFIFCARAFGTPGTPLYSLFFVSASLPGINSGALICLRLLFVVFLGSLFISCTRTAETRAALEWFLSPVPFIPSKRVAFMIGLVVRFIPMLLNNAHEIMAAQKARGIEGRKNPAFRMIKFMIPLLRRTFEQGDELVMALEARCYTDDRTGIPLKTKKNDLWVIFCVIPVSIFMVAF